MTGRAEKAATGERPIHHWNYRMFVQTRPDGTPSGEYVDEFTIREAYYDGIDPLPHSWTEDPASPFGETKLGLMEDISAMTNAIGSGLLVLSPDGQSIEREERPHGKR